ncbi:MAG: hypothetical protein GX754_10985 [Clostridiaceae bacterium]|nr:hypothetical protein [Clostridiaceae bacterium]
MEIYEDLVYFSESINDELYCLDLKSPAALVGISKVLNIGFTIGPGSSYELREAEAAFINENPEVQISYTTFNMNTPLSKVEIMASDMGLDIISLYTHFLHDFISSGAIAELSGFSDLVSLIKHEDLLDGLYDFSSIDGFFFGIPLNYVPYVLKSKFAA